MTDTPRFHYAFDSSTVSTYHVYDREHKEPGAPLPRNKRIATFYGARDARLYTEWRLAGGGVEPDGTIDAHMKEGSL